MNYFLFLLSLLSLSAFSQKQASSNVSDLADQHQLKTICTHLFSAKNDADKKKYNEELLSAFETILQKPNSFDLPFDSLKNDMGILLSPDNKFRIINWNVEKEDKTYDYYGFIQEKHTLVKKRGLFKKEKTESVLLYPLIDKSAEIRNPDNAITDNKKWFGMLYFKIIPKKTKTKTYYTLLGYDLNDEYSKKKIIDVLTFDNNGTPRFGADIFVMEKKYPKRIIFEYASTCTMSLRYSAQKDSIVFDHLAPTQPQLEGQFQYYCSDMSYDGFGFKHGKWNYGTDLNALNEKSDMDKLYHDPHKSPVPNQSDLIIDRKRKTQKKKK
ncbi:MAG TPA: hypothetical protein VLB84_01610 [Bacteroidia bacterium]|jgi:hypothetical protein|nr:hypothetical protein [Bacteroidia bacterium]